MPEVEKLSILKRSEWCWECRRNRRFELLKVPAQEDGFLYSAGQPHFAWECSTCGHIVLAKDIEWLEAQEEGGGILAVIYPVKEPA